MQNDEMFEPYDRLIDVEICGSVERVPDRNTILRCLQYLDMEFVSHADLCWNGDCLNCQVWIRNGEKSKAVIACRTYATEGMSITDVSDNLRSEGIDETATGK